jgi:hypothetical protein
MDPSDYARLVKSVKPARRPLEQVADRVVTFYDAKSHGVSTPRDGKLYMRCRRAGKQREENPNEGETVKKGGMDEAKDEKSKDDQQRMINNAVAAATASYESMGGIYGVLTVLVLVLVSGGLFFTSSGKQVAAVAFVIAFIIPHYLRVVVFSVLKMFV